MRLILSAAAIWLLVFGSTLADEPTREYKYFLWESEHDSRLLRSEITIAPGLGQVIRGGHSSSDAVFCDAKNELACVSSYGFSFAVPKRPFKSGESWSFDTHDFQVLSCDKTIQLVGVRFKNVCLIRSSAPQESGTPTEWLYSQSHGLLGFTRIFEGTESPFWLVGGLGFGADQ